MSLAIFFFIIIFLAAIQTAIPFLTKRTIVFGVTIPEKYIKDEKIIFYKKRYAILVLLISAIALGAYSIWAITSKPAEELIVLAGTVIQFGIIFISMSVYFYFHGKLSQLKKSPKFAKNLKQVQITDLTMRSQDTMLPSYVYFLPIIITIGMMCYTISQYSILPEQIPIHWGPNGQADAFTAKTPFSVITLPLILLIMQIMFLGIHIGTKKSGIKLSATHTNASKSRQLTLRKNTSWLMFLISLLLTMLFSFLQFSTIHPNLISDFVMFLVPIVFLIIVIVGTILFALKVGRADKQLPADIEGDITDFDEDSYWKGGLFYFNKNDPSIFVEKRFGVGWTLNLANPLGYLILIMPIIIILLISFL